MAQGYTKDQPLDTDVNLGGGSPLDYVAASQKATKTYVDNRLSSADATDLTDGGVTDLHTHYKLVAADGSPDPALAADNAGDLSTAYNLTLTGAGKDITILSDAGVYTRNHSMYGTIVDDFITGASFCSFDTGVWAGWQSDTSFATPSTLTTKRSLFNPYFSTGSTPTGFLKATWTPPANPSSSAFPFRSMRVAFNGANFNGSYGGYYIDDYAAGVRSNYFIHAIRYNSTGPVFEIIKNVSGVITVLKTLNDYWGWIDLQPLTFSASWASWVLTPYTSFGGLQLVPLASSTLTWTPTRAGFFMLINTASPSSGTSFYIDFVGSP